MDGLRVMLHTRKAWVSKGQKNGKRMLWSRFNLEGNKTFFIVLVRFGNNSKILRFHVYCACTLLERLRLKNFEPKKNYPYVTDRSRLQLMLTVSWLYDTLY